MFGGTVDIDDENVIAVWVSSGRSSLEAAAFLRRVRDESCTSLIELLLQFVTIAVFWSLVV